MILPVGTDPLLQLFCLGFVSLGCYFPTLSFSTQGEMNLPGCLQPPAPCECLDFPLGPAVPRSMAAVPLAGLGWDSFSGSSLDPALPSSFAIEGKMKWVALKIGLGYFQPLFGFLSWGLASKHKKTNPLIPTFLIHEPSDSWRNRGDSCLPLSSHPPSSSSLLLLPS